MHVKLQVRSNRDPPREMPSQGSAVHTRVHAGPELVCWQSWESLPESFFTCTVGEDGKREKQMAYLFAKEAVAMAGEISTRGWKTGDRKHAKFAKQTRSVATLASPALLAPLSPAPSLLGPSSALPYQINLLAPPFPFLPAQLTIHSHHSITSPLLHCIVGVHASNQEPLLQSGLIPL